MISEASQLLGGHFSQGRSREVRVFMILFLADLFASLGAMNLYFKLAG